MYTTEPYIPLFDFSIRSFAYNQLLVIIVPHCEAPYVNTYARILHALRGRTVGKRNMQWAYDQFDLYASAFSSSAI